MTDLHFPWLELALLWPLIGAIHVGRLADAHAARKFCLVYSGLAFITLLGAWEDFNLLHAPQAGDLWHWTTALVGRELFVIDQLSAPLLPAVALFFFLTILTTLRTKVRRFSFAWTLFSETLTLALFCVKEPWLIIALLAAQTVPPYWELRARGRPTRVYVLHMALFVVALVVGWSFVELEGAGQVHSWWAIVPLLLAVLIRSGIAPWHCWLTHLFEHATFGTALLVATPIAGAYAAIRLVLPIAPDRVLQALGIISLITAVYASGMALVQSEARRFFCYLFLSHSALVLVGLEMATAIGLTGALCVWSSVGLSLVGFGLTLRALEARKGRLMLDEFQGLYEHTPALAVCFFLTGLGCIGFPGTLGFVGTELLIDGVVEVYPYTCVAVLLAGALNSIAFVKAYFWLFTGTRHISTVSLAIGVRERFAVLLLAVLIILGGVFPQPGVESRYHAATEILHERERIANAEITLRSHQPSTIVEAKTGDSQQVAE